MNRYIVYTSVAEYHVVASSESAARRHVYRLTLGRVPFADMRVVKKGVVGDGR